MRFRFLALALLCSIALSTGATPSPQTQPQTSPQSSPAALASTANADSTPPQTKKFTGYSLSPELYKKAKRLAAIRFSFHTFSFVFSLFALWLTLRLKWSAKFRDWAERATQRQFLRGLIYAPLFIATLTLLQLPLDLFNESLLKRYGISVQPWAAWAGDWGKSLLLSIVIGSMLILILFAVIRRSPRRWWLYFWIISIPISLAIFFVEPLVIDPMFSKFEPLSAKAPALIPQLERLTVRGGMPIPPDRMFWMLASDKTIFTNAYVTGFGATKRVVIWDTSIDKETTDGILLMFGHEMGHYVLFHIPKEMAIYLSLLLVLIYLGYRLAHWMLARWGKPWKIGSLGDWASLPLLFFILTALTFLATPVFNAISRHFEHEADRYGVEVIHGIVPSAQQAAARGFERSGELDLADPNPSAFMKFWMFDHPTRPERVHFVATYDPWAKGESPRYVH